MKNCVSRFRFEEKTLRAMIAIYCARMHGQGGPPATLARSDCGLGALCAECAALERYALNRLENCVFGAQKPTCAACAIHCYQPTMREKVQAVMRFSGPLMLKYHPILALVHLLRRFRRQAPKPQMAGKSMGADCHSRPDRESRKINAGFPPSRE
ncbi:MAG: nitrous oxide-stimulated promoter family protein [Lentisphaerae bacterium]|nr:nitrous oxide-stimulated promoter family protein [Lentisphaerota bacterium]